MKKVFRDTCILFALAVLSVFVISIVWVGVTDEIRLVLELFALSFVISLGNYFLDEYTSLPVIGSYAVKYIAATAAVMLFGFIVGWFYRSNFWMAFIYVGVITVIVYALDSVKTEKDIEEINEMVRLNKHEKIEFMPLKKRKGWNVGQRELCGVVFDNLSELEVACG